MPNAHRTAGLAKASNCLLELPLFTGCTADDLKCVADLIVRRRHAAAQTMLVRQGEFDGKCHGLFSGWVIRFVLLPDGRRQVLGVMLPGDMVGFEAVLGEPSYFSAETLTDVSYCTIDARELSDRLSLSPRLGHALTSYILRYRRFLELKLTNLGQCTAEEHVAALLLHIHARLGRLGLLKGDSFTLPLTQQHQADVLGLTAIHMNRVLRRMRDQGLIAVAGREVTISNIAALRKLAPLQIQFEYAGPYI